MAEIIKAKITGIRPYANNWSILYCEQGGKAFRANGTLLHDPESLKGVVCTLEGEWETHPKHGAGFKFASVSPDGSEMFFFLTRVVKVGEKPAQAMTEMFSDDELTAIMETPDRHNELLRVKGVGDARLDKITESWQKYRHVKLLSDFLTPYGMTPNLIMRVYNYFEDRSVEIVRENPYQLTRVPGIGFKKADEVALRLGTMAHDPFRLAACIEYVVTNMAEDGGSTLVRPEDVIASAQKELDCDAGRVDKAEIETELAQMASRGGIIQLDGMLALARYHTTEKRLLEALKSRLAMPPIPVKSASETTQFITDIQRELGITFSEEQAGAIRQLAIGHRTIVVTGYAGTGKTTTSKALIRFLLSKFNEDDVCCMALSGIAADRIRKTTGFTACTIHTALGWKGNEFERGADNKLGYKVVLVDEGSMVNSSILRRVIEAVDRDAILILMGDPGQLPPIGAGDPFRNIIESGLVPVARLTKIYRQGKDSVLTLFANDIRQGLVPQGYSEVRGFKDFQFVERNLPRNYFRLSDKDKAAHREENAKEILKFIETKLKALAPHIEDPITDFQLLSPMRKGPLGTEVLNQMAQRVFNPTDRDGRMIQIGNVVFKAGDKVVHTQNKDMQTMKGCTLQEYYNGCWVAESRRVFNGSVGLILDADPGAQQLLVAYPEGFIARYEALHLSAGVLEHAFALTAHKCQGSEYKWVLLPVSSAHMIMLTAQWLYTAITRAKAKVLIVGQNYMFERACKSLSKTQRTTVLERLCAS